ncbi:pectinesterase 4-like [Primulina tabacum]|uniref:pectinesterase 4-like n=1 Tax=Primulina tabacum TaxID=48773 RepID=UPI003F5A23C9
MGAGKKVGISVVSLILVVGAVIGVVAVVRSSENSANDESGKSPSASMKAIDSICAPTSYKDACTRTLGPVARNETATPKDYIMAAIQATLEEVQKSFEVTSKTIVNNETDPYNHMAVEDCKELLDQAIDTLQASYSMVGDSDMHTLQDRADELRSWMTSVYALQSSCMDQIEKPEYKSAIENGMINATQLTDNAINIVAELSEVLKAFNVPINLRPNARRLMGSNSYPSWFDTSDRRLLRAQRGGHIRPNVVVAKDGSGQFRTVASAINAYPKNYKGRFIIYVKTGIYDEFIVIDKNKPNIFLYGDGPGKTIITGKRNFGIMKIGTMNTATFSNNAPGFIARRLTFRNTAGPDGHQAVALRINGDMSAIFDCHIEGYQDTLYYHTSRQFYRDCVISGTIDFIFGMGDAVIQNSLIVVRRPNANQFNTVTADGKEVARGSNGLVLQNCRIVPEKELFPVRFQIPSYLGRPWKAQSLTVVMQSELGDLIRPEGWMPWSTTDPNYFFHNTCQYYEFANRGPGANTAGRSRMFKHFKVLSPQEATRYTVAAFLQGAQWLKQAHIPHQLGL